MLDELLMILSIELIAKSRHVMWCHHWPKGEKPDAESERRIFSFRCSIPILTMKFLIE